MERMELEVFSTASDAAVVRVPGRRFPGVVIQGDSLKILWDEVRTARERASSPEGREELAGTLEHLEELLAGYLCVYEETLRAHGLELPYGSRPTDG